MEEVDNIIIATLKDIGWYVHHFDIKNVVLGGAKYPVTPV